MDPRIQKAKQAGYSDAEIQAYLAKKQAIPQSDPIPGIVKAGVPVAGGAIGGAAAGLPGMGLGAMGGQALINLIERAIGGPTPQNVGENAKSLGLAAGAQYAGEGAGRALGFLANPIRSLGGMVDRTLAGSGKAINLDELFKLFKGNLPKTVGEMAGKGPETQTALNELATRLGQMVHARLPYEGASASVPVAVANDIKRAIPNLGNLLGNQTGGKTVADMYGGLSAPGYEVPKAFVSTLRDAIQKAVPGVKIPNTLMHYLYQVPNFMEGLTYGLPWAAGRSVRALGSDLAKVPGAIVPESGGLLKYLLQLGLQGGQQNSQSN